MNQQNNKLSEEIDVVKDESATDYLRYDIKENTIEEERNLNGDFFSMDYKKINEYDLFSEDLKSLSEIWTPIRKNGKFVNLFKFTDTDDSSKNINITEMSETFEANCIYMEVTSKTKEQREYWIGLRNLKDEFFGDLEFLRYKVVYFYLKNIKGLMNIYNDKDYQTHNFHDIDSNFYNCLQESEIINYGDDIAPFNKNDKLISSLQKRFIEPYLSENKDEDVITNLYEYVKFRIAIILKNMAEFNLRSKKDNTKIIELSEYDEKTFYSIKKRRDYFKKLVSKIKRDTIISLILLVFWLAFFITACSILPSPNNWIKQNWKSVDTYIYIGVGALMIILIFVLYFKVLTYYSVNIMSKIIEYNNTKKKDEKVNVYSGIELSDIYRKYLSKITYFFTIIVSYPKVKRITKQ